MNEPRVWVPAPPVWLWNTVFGLTSAALVVQVVIWIGEFLEAGGL